MRSLAALLSLLMASSTVFGAAPVSPATGVTKDGISRAIERGLVFLKQDALAWKKKYNCASCHHASLVIWSMHEVQRRGMAVDRPFLAEMTKWVAQSGDGKTGVPRPAGIPKALNSKAVQFTLGLGADPAPNDVSQAGMKLMLKTVEGDQLENGSWAAWPETRPPFFGGSNDSMTALATLAVLPAATAGDAAAKTTLDKAVGWVTKTKTDDDPQSVALRLVLWRRLGRPTEECQPLVDRIKGRQNADGGWSQAPDMTSDAWATGQALYALAHAGLGPGEPAIARGHAFLTRTQRDDGSWPMTSRPIKPGGAGSTSLVPITGAGTAWAVIGLARSH
jgi:hypothetical protein